MSHIIKLLKALDVTAQKTESVEADLSPQAAVSWSPAVVGLPLLQVLHHFWDSGEKC